MGYVEDEFDDLKELFKVSKHFSQLEQSSKLFKLQMFDCDQDGILNLMEVQHVLRCIGFRANVEQVVLKINCV